MARRNFIDWNGNGRLDPQDLVTGVGMDVVEREKDDQQHNKQSLPPSGGSGCMLSVLGIFAAILIVPLALFLL